MTPPNRRRVLTDLQDFVNAFREMLGLDPLYQVEGASTVERFYQVPPSAPYACTRSHRTGFSVLGSCGHEDDEVHDASNDDTKIHHPLRFETPLRARAKRRWARVRRERGEDA